MNCTNPYFRVLQKAENPFEGTDKGIFTPCGKCLACRINRRREWTQRLLHESYNYPAVFITLTYNEEHLPFDENGQQCVSKSDIQHFIQDLRNEYRGVKIRYFIGSEYGDLGRPHYHGILYNVPPDLLDRSKNWQPGMPLTKKSGKYVSIINRKLNDIWKRGFCTIGEMSRGRAGYCAKYFVDRKDAPSGAVPNFSLMSRRPGIGSLHAEAISDKVRFHQSHSLLTDNGKYIALPRYYDRKIYTDEERKERLEGIDLTELESPILERINSDSMDIIDYQLHRHHSYKNLKKQL
nr:MAG: replication initiator protein [Microvirus sp.]